MMNIDNYINKEIISRSDRQ